MGHVFTAKRYSKFLSLVLRHKPKTIDVAINNSGWVSIKDLIEKSKLKGIHLTEDIIKEIVATNDKKRFAISDDGKDIRASQGHSIKIDLGLIAKEPPDFLYHGTTNKFLDSILKDGLQKQKRNHVHLSKDIQTATEVGRRRTQHPVILKIESKKMYDEGYQFYLSDNGVWLVDNVPVRYFYKIRMKMFACGAKTKPNA